MNTNHLAELESSIAELPNGHLTNALKEKDRYQPTRPLPFYCPHCHLPVYLDRKKGHYFFAHPVDNQYLECPQVKAAISYLERKEKLAEDMKWLKPLEPVHEWYCVMCKQFYMSTHWPVVKCCPKCREGIYSIPASNVTDDHNTFHYAQDNHGVIPIEPKRSLRLTPAIEPELSEDDE